MKLKHFFDLNSCLSREVVINKAVKSLEIKAEIVEKEYRAWRKEFLATDLREFIPVAERKVPIKNLEEFIKYYASKNRKKITEEEIRDISNFLMLGLSVADLSSLKKWEDKNIFRIYANLRKHDFFKKGRRVLYKKSKQ
ncbi:hypothetical protein KLF37_07195 [Clostridium perfringens]|uniref:hypothetical protein n=1 Tax=Clostridium perfringens TaxID=1502 RepID=UPI001CC92271|nr:hypothetical protein [Clostridium perfringens]UBK93104.1 hypothetical protein KLF37_07195 [Clostridium perfringens]